MKEIDGIKEKYILFVEDVYGIPREEIWDKSYDEIDDMIYAIKIKTEKKQGKKKRGK